MAGKSTSTLWTYLTPRRVYRYQVSTADTTLEGLPVIHADVCSKAPGSLEPSSAGNVSGFGSNTTLALSVLKVAGSSTKVNVWMYANAEGKGYPGTPENFSAVANWVLVHSQPVSQSVLIVLNNLPAAKYCVSFTEHQAGTAYTIMEQHSE